MIQEMAAILIGETRTKKWFRFAVAVLMAGTIWLLVFPCAAAKTQKCNRPPTISNIAKAISSDGGSLTITWDTDTPSDTQVLWGMNDHLGGKTIGAIDTITGKTTGHSYTIDGLFPRFGPYGFYIYSRCVDERGPSRDPRFGSNINQPGNHFLLTLPLPIGAFQYTTQLVGAHSTFPGYPLFFNAHPVPLRADDTTPTWNYTISLSGPSGWPISVETPAGITLNKGAFTRTQYHGSGEPYSIRVDVPSNAAPGAYTIGIHVTDNTYKAAAQDSTWTIHVLDPEKDRVRQSTPRIYPPIPCLTGKSRSPNGHSCDFSWVDGMHTAMNTKLYPAGRGPCQDNDVLPNGYGMSYEAFSWYYDGIRVYWNAKNYLKNSSFDRCLNSALAYYRDRQVLFYGGGAGQGRATFARGLYTDYLVTRDQKDLEAMNDLAIAPRTPYVNFGAEMIEYGAERELAYRLEAEYIYAKLGHTERQKIFDRALALAIGHLDQACVSQEGWRGVAPASVQPSFIGLTADILLYYFDDGHQSDIRIPWAVKQCGDWMATHAWRDTREMYVGNGITYYFDYLVDQHDKLGNDGTSDYRVLNQLISPMYAWLFQYTGNATIPGTDGLQCYGAAGRPCTYQQLGDAAFASAAGSSGDSTSGSGNIDKGKTYSQEYRWSFDYVKWRSPPADGEHR
jgi:hypothetical protein